MDPQAKSRKSPEGISRYQYTADNLLASFEGEDGETTRYSYAAIGRRVGKEGSAMHARYLYDGLEVLQEELGGESPESALYSRAGSMLLSRQISGGSNEVEKLFYSHDALGSVIALSDNKGKLATRYHYDAFGELLEDDISKNEYTFTGQRLDPESGLYHFHFRKYDAEAAAWITPDPIGILGGINLYQYAGNNPINAKDWLGLLACGGCHGTSEQVYGKYAPEAEFITQGIIFAESLYFGLWGRRDYFNDFSSSTTTTDSGYYSYTGEDLFGDYSFEVGDHFGDFINDNYGYASQSDEDSNDFGADGDGFDTSDEIGTES